METQRPVEEPLLAAGTTMPRMRPKTALATPLSPALAGCEPCSCLKLEHSCGEKSLQVKKHLKNPCGKTNFLETLWRKLLLLTNPFLTSNVWAETSRVSPFFSPTFKVARRYATSLPRLNFLRPHFSFCKLSCALAMAYRQAGIE